MTETLVRYELPSRKARRLWLWAGALGAGLFALAAALQVNPFDFVTQFHHLADLAERMLPPHLGVLVEASTWASAVETLAIALFATIAGCSTGLGAALIAASNTTPHPAARLLTRVLMALERAATAFLILMIMLIAFGIGPLPTALTLTLSTVGMFGRLFADAIEQAEPQPAEALVAAGATRSQAIAFAVLPQVWPALASLAMYALEVNVRNAIALGLFGGGGLGFELHRAHGALRYKDVLGYAILTVAIVMLVERTADALRRRLIRN